MLKNCKACRKLLLFFNQTIFIDIPIAIIK